MTNEQSMDLYRSMMSEGSDEPVSHVFYLTGEEDEDDRAAIRLVGEQDVANTVQYWKDRARAAEARLSDIEDDDKDERGDY